jgi:lysozyme
MLSIKGLAAIKLDEGLFSANPTKLVKVSNAKDLVYPYRDPTGTITIGYGNTFYANGQQVRITDKPITQSEANELFSKISNAFALKVKMLVKSKINQSQLDALVSFSYNVGLSAFSKSTLLKLVNINPNDVAIKNEFLKWTKSKGVVLNGLVKRRQRESDTYFSNSIDLQKFLIPIAVFFYSVYTLSELLY